MIGYFYERVITFTHMESYLTGQNFSKTIKSVVRSDRLMVSMADLQNSPSAVHNFSPAQASP
ncbi:hypothetical protein GDI1470 [Gluconacetobacter diazotrophicus PA1 5]|uniref:Uncharacterized protein n=1 Tax=Gluconacetobacter diazotrophicus (strain ATCC 49037 / DSM 5601 / CCUG 37298 / CIP 103539 / LMG 7603 / PAl5) TaxID=272568 RepID=A9HFV2_GLUDA|nr:hypothetical protein GDI1470 [Gluconacetobacter diazotrophicus PA1 5]